MNDEERKLEPRVFNESRLQLGWHRLAFFE
jgi:hypothetical protein